MTPNADLQPAFILQHQHYRETSLLLDVLTYDDGRLRLVAKGVRKSQSKTAALLQPFVPLKVSYIGKTELKTLSYVETVAPQYNLQGLALYCGFYVNELIERFLHPHDPHPDVFLAYQRCLSQLAENNIIQISLRLFELALLEHTGYGLDFEQDAQTQLAIAPHLKYRYQPGIGLVADDSAAISGATLQALAKQDLSSSQVQLEAKLLLRSVIDSHLQGKPLNSRAVIQQIINSGIYATIR
jgi:DNA repair protein RecO (recombination protein O)